MTDVLAGSTNVLRYFTTQSTTPPVLTLLGQNGDVVSIAGTVAWVPAATDLAEHYEVVTTPADIPADAAGQTWRAVWTTTDDGVVTRDAERFTITEDARAALEPALAASIDKLAIRLPDADRGLLELLFADATTDLLRETHLIELPASAEPLVRKLAIIAYNRDGNEGLSGTGAAGVSDSFINGLPGDVKNAIYALRVVPW